MLHQQNTSGTSSDTQYLAFRAAYLTTVDLLFAEIPNGHASGIVKGFLERLPLLVGCAPQIQLQCLLNTWHKLKQGASADLNDLDRCVWYCAAAELAKLGSVEDIRRIEQSVAGPRPMPGVDCLWVASKLRTMQITWPFEQDCGVVLRDGNFLDGDLDVVSPLNAQGETASEMLDLAGKWFVTPDLLTHADGLITPEEHARLAAFFQEYSSLMNL